MSGVGIPVCNFRASLASAAACCVEKSPVFVEVKWLRKIGWDVAVKNIGVSFLVLVCLCGTLGIWGLRVCGVGGEHLVKR